MRRRWNQLVGIICAIRNQIKGYESVTWHDMTIKPGDTLFLDPDSFQLKLDWIVKKERVADGEEDQEQSYDEEEYPEKYRKTETIKGSNSDTPDPFCIGHVVSIACSAIVSKSAAQLTIKLAMRLNWKDSSVSWRILDRLTPEIRAGSFIKQIPSSSLTKFKILDLM